MILRPRIIRDRDEISPRIIRSLDEVLTAENRRGVRPRLASENPFLDMARATPCQNTVLAARQNLAECCAKCFVCANRPLPTVVLRMMLRMVPTALRTLLLRLLPRVITTLLPRRCPAAANCAANPIAKPVQPCC